MSNEMGKLNTTAELIQALAKGEMVVVMDDETRENEGDLIIAAEKITPEIINFMATQARGLICLTLTKARCQQLQLPLMVGNRHSYHRTNFTLSIEAAKQVTTGISAQDRATTVLAAVAKNARPEDLVQPGHIFPVMACAGGVLERAGHTEAGCDLAQLAGLEPAAVIVEILNADGSMARREQLQQFAQQHQLKIGTIADLIAYRLAHEKTAVRTYSCPWPTEYGDFQLVCYKDEINRELHYALVLGEVAGEEPVLVKVHAPNILDVLGYEDKNSGRWPMAAAMQKIQAAGKGVIVVLHSVPEQDPEQTLDFFQQIQNVGLQQSSEEHEVDLSRAIRRIGIGSQILADLGVHKMRVLSSPLKLPGLAGFKLAVSEYLPYHKSKAAVNCEGAK